MSKSWRPTKRQLETLADCAAAGLDAARTARLLGIDETVFAAWVKRMKGAVAYEERMIAEALAAPPVPSARLRPI